ncbi:MAG: hypothetical protein ACO4AU_06795 [bacterium]
MVHTIQEQQVISARTLLEDPNFSLEEKVEMLMELAMGLQHKPKSVDQLHQALELYAEAFKLCPPGEALLQARIRARTATALQSIPHQGTEFLQEAREHYEQATPILKQLGLPEELAEAEMNLGLVLQSLTSAGEARITDVIAAYQRSLRVFTRSRYPTEFAILHNNLATAFLSIPMSDERGKMREALAVQSFEEALSVVTLIDHPSEYAMLQNNLGNALQYCQSSHPLENNLRALEAYDEALKVRNARDTPMEYANTISNKANVLWNLSTAAAGEEAARLCLEAKALYEEAARLFGEYGDWEKQSIVSNALAELEQDLPTTRTEQAPEFPGASSVVS